MDVYQRAWASLLQRIETKTSWGRNELKDTMLGALMDAADDKCFRCGHSPSECTDKAVMANSEPLRDFRTPKEVDYPSPLPYVGADAVQRKAQNDV